MIPPLILKKDEKQEYLKTGKQLGNPAIKKVTKTYDGFASSS